MQLRFDTGATLVKIEAQRIYRRLNEWAARERWWCGAPHLMIEHGDASRLYGTLDASFGDTDPLDLAMGNRDAELFCGYLATTGADWKIAMSGGRNRDAVPDPEAVFAAHADRYSDQIGGSSSLGIGAAAHYRRWLLETVRLVDVPEAPLPARTDGEVRRGLWRWSASRDVTPIQLADRAALALELRPIGPRWRDTERATITDQLRGVLATQQAYQSSAMPLEQAGPTAEQWVTALDGGIWLVNGNTTESWQPLGDMTFETAFAGASDALVALIYIGDED